MLLDSRQGGNQHATSSSMSNTKKSNEHGLCVLGYDNVKSVLVNAEVRQELDYLDREVRTSIDHSIVID
jgi:hypothetical protein